LMLLLKLFPNLFFEFIVSVFEAILNIFLKIFLFYFQAFIVSVSETL
jgi:hypothetical protein